MSYKDKVEKEIFKIRNKFAAFNSLHEAYGVIKEEFDELWEEIKLKPKVRSKKKIIGESVQIIALLCVLCEDLQKNGLES